MFFNKKKIASNLLIVEDDALLAKVLITVFKDAGFNVGLSEDGLKVMDMALSFKPKIILLDLILPGIDGFEVLRRLKAESKTKSIPVVVISNLGDEAEIKSAKALGAENYFIKSNIGLDKLVSTIKSMVG